jgi:hypothetical protein
MAACNNLNFDKDYGKILPLRFSATWKLKNHDFVEKVTMMSRITLNLKKEYEMGASGRWMMTTTRSRRSNIDSLMFTNSGVTKNRAVRGSWGQSVGGSLFRHLAVTVQDSDEVVRETPLASPLHRYLRTVTFKSSAFLLTLRRGNV